MYADVASYRWEKTKGICACVRLYMLWRNNQDGINVGVFVCATMTLVWKHGAAVSFESLGFQMRLF